MYLTNVVKYSRINTDKVIMEYFTPHEIAKNLKLNVLTVYKYIKRGNLSAVRFGRYYRVSQEDLERFLTASRVSRTKKA